MVVAAFVVSLVALALAGVSAAYTRTQAKAAKNADHRARHPILGITLDAPESAGIVRALYHVENQGQEDLDSVVVFRPVTGDGVEYAVAKLGTDFGDSAELGPLEIKARQGFVLSIGSADDLPDFRVRIRTRIGRDTWENAYVLDDPRFHIGIY